MYHMFSSTILLVVSSIIYVTYYLVSTGRLKPIREMWAKATDKVEAYMRRHIQHQKFSNDLDDIMMHDGIVEYDNYKGTQKQWLREMNMALNLAEIYPNELFISAKSTSRRSV
jgi:hypothetical protein